MIDLSKRMTSDRLDEFVSFILNTQGKIGFKVSSRGWCYILEQNNIITKDQFDKVEGLINKCRKEGHLPVDFVAEEEARMFKEVHEPSNETIDEHILGWVDALLGCDNYYEPDWWEGEEYYIQTIVEKIDLVTLFQPLCHKYHIPIANAKGWSSILQRADYARRFKAAEERGLKCVLLYCGDHDPDGLRISDVLRKNIEDVQDIYWSKGGGGYNPDGLIIERFGLNYEFIIDNQLSWIDNLITGSGKNLANPNHPNYHLPYLQDYLHSVGERKCEANSLVIRPQAGQQLFRETIERYLGADALGRFEAKNQEIADQIKDRMEEVDLWESLKSAREELGGE